MKTSIPAHTLIGSNQFFIEGFINTLGAKPVVINGITLQNGNTDLYTCPPNKKAFIVSVTISNASVSSAISSVLFVDGASSHRISSQVTTTSNQTSLITGCSLFLESGQKLAVASNTNQAYAFAIVFEIDSSLPIKTAFINNFSVGDNLIYTCPANKMAFITKVSSNCFGAVDGKGSFLYSNFSGANISVRWYLVRSGLVPDNTTALGTLTVNVTNTSLQNSSDRSPLLDEGDSVQIQSSSAATGQLAWVNLIEFEK